MIEKIRAQVGKGRVICGLSGGVDSSVAAVLIHEAIGEQLTCIYVDHGLMRLNESEEVVTMFRDHYNIPLVHVDASEAFLGALAGESDPEKKRKTIGRLFIETFEAEAKKIGGAQFLAQGTLYPDVIESVSFSGGPSVVIKSHHNVGGLPERMNMQLVEPLRELFKDEVRALGRELGLPEKFVGRHPFPGPGLAIRLPGGVSPEKLDILRKADAIYLDEIRKAGLYDKIWQAFAVLLPVQTVGVMGDGRTYEFVCALRAVTSVDGMTADFYPFDMAFIGQVATRIINEVRGINRVVYDVTSASRPARSSGNDSVEMQSVRHLFHWTVRQYRLRDANRRRQRPIGDRLVKTGEGEALSAVERAVPGHEYHGYAKPPEAGGDVDAAVAMRKLDIHEGKIGICRRSRSLRRRKVVRLIRDDVPCILQDRGNLHGNQCLVLND